MLVKIKRKNKTKGQEEGDSKTSGGGGLWSQRNLPVASCVERTLSGGTRQTLSGGTPQRTPSPMPSSLQSPEPSTMQDTCAQLMLPQ